MLEEIKELLRKDGLEYKSITMNDGFPWIGTNGIIELTLNIVDSHNDYYQIYLYDYYEMSDGM